MKTALALFSKGFSGGGVGRGRAALGLGLVDAQGLSDQQAASSLWSSPLFTESTDARSTTACACSIVNGFAAKTRLDVSLVGVMMLKKKMMMRWRTTEERQAPPRNRRQRLVRFLCRVIERCHGDDALSSVALSRAVDAVASLLHRDSLCQAAILELLKGSDEHEEDAWALPTIEEVTPGRGEPPHAPWRARGRPVGGRGSDASSKLHERRIPCAARRFLGIEQAESHGSTKSRESPPERVRAGSVAKTKGLWRRRSEGERIRFGSWVELYKTSKRPGIMVMKIHC